MTSPEVFVDTTFIVAVADASLPDHPRARPVFADLVTGMRDARLRLVSHAMAVGAASERLAGDARGDTGLRLGDLVAPIDVEPVHSDALRLARRALASEPALTLLQALTLALVARRKISAIATFDPVYARYGLAVIPAATPAATMPAAG